MVIGLITIAIVWIIVIIMCINSEVKYRKVIKEYDEIMEKFNKIVEEYDKKHENHDNDWK